MKAIKGGAFMKLLMVALTLACLLSQPRLASGVSVSVSPSQCKAERQSGVDNCLTVLFGQAPSAACCRIIKVGHFECACPAINLKLAALVTVNRVMNLLKTCGRAVPRKFQCGSLHFLEILVHSFGCSCGMSA